MTDRRPIIMALLLVAAASNACRSAADTAPPILQPGAPGEDTRAIPVQRAVDLSKVQHTEADVRFMQGMIGHHAQALEMSALVPSRTSREEMKRLAQRIELSQLDEIKMMQTWLRARGQPIPDEHAHHAHDYKPMPGMLTPDEMRRLTEARGVEFDRLFLELMVRHHEGALLMVEELMTSPGAAQEGDINAFATDVVADQAMEIDRMKALWASLRAQ
ncbi:MAG: DUF305 domain-containing protein [Acidobacteriota bacterium]